MYKVGQQEIYNDIAGEWNENHTFKFQIENNKVRLYRDDTMLYESPEDAAESYYIYGYLYEDDARHTVNYNCASNVIPYKKCQIL